MWRTRVPRSRHGARALMLSTVAIVLGCGLYFEASRFIKFRNMYVAMANVHARRAAYYRSLVPEARNDLERLLRRRRDEAAALASWGEEPPIAEYKRQREDHIANAKLRIFAYPILAKHHDQLRAKYRNASRRWPLQALSEDPPEPIRFDWFDGGYLKLGDVPDPPD